MKYSRIKTFCFSLVFLAVAVLVWECGTRSQLEEGQLSNGIPIVFWKKPGSPVATIHMVVRAGSVYETETTRGISRLLGRCLFRVSAKYPDIRKTIESYGGEFYSGVYQDFMSFAVAVEKSYLLDMVPLFSDVLDSSRFDDALVSSVKNNLLYVMKEEQSNPRIMVLNLFLENAFQNHSYRFLPLGNFQTSKTLRTQDVVRYFQNQFVQENIAFVITADVDRKIICKRFNEFLGSFVRKSSMRSVPAVEPEQNAPREVVARRPLPKKIAFVSVGWKAPGIHNPDTFPVDVLVSCLGMGEASRLNTQIRNNMDSVYSIWAEYLTPKEPGYLLISSVCHPDVAFKVKNRILCEIEILKKDEITPAELKRAKAALKYIKAYGDESTSGIAGYFGYCIILDAMDFGKTYSKRIEAVTSKDIERMASKYLKNNNSTSVILLPEKNTGGISK